MESRSRGVSGRSSTSPDGADTGLSIVLPVYNEQDCIREVVDELLEYVCEGHLAAYEPIEVLLVDDGSTDGTREILAELASSSELVTAIQLRRNFGQSCALAAGMDAAEGKFVVTMDADGQNDPVDIKALLATLQEGYDCVSGWRRTRNDPVTKRVPSAIQTYLAQLTGPNIHDFGCTLKVYQREALQSIQLYGEGHRYIPAKLHRWGFDITEQEVNHRERFGGETKYGTPRLLKGLLDLWFHVFWSRFSTRPLHFLGGVGLVVAGAGGLIGAHAVAMKYLFDVALLDHLPRLILTVALVLFGALLIVFGFLAEMLIMLQYRDEKPYRVEAVLSGETE